MPRHTHLVNRISSRRIPQPVARLAQSGAERARLVLVEDGVQHFDRQLPPDDSEHTVVVAQLSQESNGLLIHRVHRALSSLGRSGKRVAPAILVLNTRRHPSSFQPRLLLCKAMLALTRADAAPISELVLIAEDCPPEMRLELLSLVETLVGEAGAEQTPIRLRFPKSTHTEPAPKSGIFPRLAVGLASGE